MPNNPRCYFGCIGAGALHKFPNWSQDHQQERFKKWKEVLHPETQERGDSYIFNMLRLCDNHFEEYYKSKQSQRLLRNAVPTLNLAFPSLSLTTWGFKQSQDMTQHREAATVAAISQDVIPSTSSQDRAPETRSGKCQSKVTGVKQPRRLMSINNMVHLKQRIHKLKLKCKSQRQQIATAKKLSASQAFIKIINSMPDPIRIFTKMQLQHRKKSKGRRFTLDEKIIALSIYKKGPKVYKFLNQIFVLPSKRILQKLLTAFSFQPGINRHIFDDLKRIVSKLPEEKKRVCLLFDEMSLEAGLSYDPTLDKIIGFEDFGEQKSVNIANHACVFMIKSIKGKIKQPVSFIFCKNSTKKEVLKNLIVTIIHQLRECGLYVVATICDQAQTNASAIKSLQEGTKQKYLQEGKLFDSCSFEVDNIKVYPLFDTPHLLKGVRNNLLIKNATFMQKGVTKTAKWEHLKMLFEMDEGEDEIRILNKLTEKHIKEQKIPKMKVKYAAQVFSQRVSAVMRFLAKRRVLPAECIDTADFLLIFDKLFDSFNGSSYQKQSKIYKSCLKTNSPHFKLWADLIPILESITFPIHKKIKNEIVHESIPSIKNWINNIKCFNEMFADLQRNHNIINLLTRNFNQDPLENFFSSIRSHGARNTNPTCIQFISSFKTLIVNNFNSVHSPQANCEYDDNQCMQSLKNLIIVRENNEMSSPDFECEIDSLLDVISDIQIDRNLSLLHVESKKYVTGYLIKKCKTKIFRNCNDCNNDLLKSNVDVDSFNYEADYTKRSLFHPSDQFNELMNEIYFVIVACLRKFPESEYLSKKIKFYIDCACDFSPLTCSKHRDSLIDFIKQIACKLIIHSWCNNVNRILNGKIIKFDPNDSIKKQAFDYYRKKK